MSRESNRRGDHLVIGGPARADLLPPEVGAMAQGRVIRRNSIALTVIAVIIVVAAYAGATVLTITAQGQLDAAKQRTQTLLTEQGKYIEVRQVTTMLAAGEAAKKVGTSTEIDWKAYLDDIQASLPAGTMVTNVRAETATPITDFGQPTVPLQGSRIGELVFTATSRTLPDVEKWLDSLAELHGYVDAAPGSVTLDGQAGIYQVSITMHIDTDALLLRYDDAAREARDKARADEEAENAKTEGNDSTESSTESGNTDADGGE